MSATRRFSVVSFTSSYAVTLRFRVRTRRLNISHTPVWDLRDHAGDYDDFKRICKHYFGVVQRDDSKHAPVTVVSKKV